MKKSFRLVVVLVLLSNPSFSQVNWKPYFTLASDEGTSFVVDTAAMVPGGGVPVLNITNAGKIILTSAGGPQMQAFEVSNNGGTYTPTSSPARGPDGGFIYLTDGRTRFLSEEPDPTRTPQRHKSRVVSWISSDGMNWLKEAGIRYQPGLEDDSISSVVSVIQVRDSVWRMYFVGDWYRTNGTRTAISTDWGLSWQQESRNNILRRGDVDPHPVYVTNGKVRLYFRTGFNSPDPAERGIAYCESNDGLIFDTLQTRMLVPDSAAPRLLKLDPWVVRFPSGAVACYIGAAPGPGSPTQDNPRLIAAWQRTATKVEFGEVPSSFQLFQNYPNPFNPGTTISFRLSTAEFVNLRVFDFLGREIVTLLNEELQPGVHSVRFYGGAGSFSDGRKAGLTSGIYFYQLRSKQRSETRAMMLTK